MANNSTPVSIPNTADLTRIRNELYMLNGSLNAIYQVAFASNHAHVDPIHFATLLLPLKQHLSDVIQAIPSE